MKKKKEHYPIIHNNIYTEYKNIINNDDKKLEASNSEDNITINKNMIKNELDYNRSHKKNII